MNSNLPIRITHPDKLYWPEEKYTKLDLIRFYDRVFPRLQPYVEDRLLVLERCPSGMRGACFFQKEKPAGLPAGTPTKTIVHENRATHYVVGGSKETQLALVNLGTLAVHFWNSRARAPRRPDWVCFDLDPASGAFADAARAGLQLRELLDEIGLESFPKTSGGKGLHVFVPLRPGPDVDAVLDFAQQVARQLARAHPEELTVEVRKNARRGRVYLDVMRNAWAQTVAAPFCVRYRPHAPVSTPLAWSEVRPDLDPADFNLGNFFRVRKRDPWSSFFQRRQSLVAATRALASLEREVADAIGIGAGREASTRPLPHHPACGSAPGGSSG